MIIINDAQWHIKQALYYLMGRLIIEVIKYKIWIHDKTRKNLKDWEIEVFHHDRHTLEYQANPGIYFIPVATHGLFSKALTFIKNKEIPTFNHIINMY